MSDTPKPHVKTPPVPVKVDPKTLRLCVGALALGLAVLLAFGLLDWAAPLFGGGAIADQNHAYLTASREQVGDDLIALTELLAVVKVIESASLGIDVVVHASVEVGQAAAAFGLALERAWGAMAVAGVIDESLLGLTAIAAALTKPLLVIVLASVGLWILARTLKLHIHVLSLVRTVAELSLVLFLALHLLVPYSLQITGWASNAVLDSLLEAQRTGLHQMHQDVSSYAKHDRSFEGWTKGNDVGAAYATVVDKLPQKLGVIERYTTGRIARSVLVGLVIPIGSFALLWLTFRSIIRRMIVLFESAALSG
ncbi:hypothetical protein [Pacificoceanicola onchidii]|uniref:hypothetical protein n=1 Tax=Pacificoceanicola onchidii TaxID=2562685 RepID=UPI0010A6597E|nr:hypothetical protein [Pacificoceanicola onchidii]